jgi:hypothetical protein
MDTQVLSQLPVLLQQLALTPQMALTTGLQVLARLTPVWVMGCAHEEGSAQLNVLAEKFQPLLQAPSQTLSKAALHA